MILIVAYPGEEHSEEVMRRLEQAGHEVILLDLSDFSGRASLTLAWMPDVEPSFLVQREGGTVELTNTRVGWWRRVRPFTIHPSIIDPSMRAFAESETSQAVSGMLDALPCTWVNNRAADEVAHHKPYQWSVAQAVGLRVPKTLVASDAASAREFVNCMEPGKTVFKSFIAMTESWRETRLVETSDLEHLDAVHYAPVIFQEYIPGVDLRITIVGDTVFAAEIDARDTRYPVDMRMVVGEANVRAVELPDSLDATLLELQRRLGLSYGAIDMRRTDKGEYVFLENNPAGQWMFVELRTGLPISQAMANLLARLDGEPTAGVHA